MRPACPILQCCFPHHSRIRVRRITWRYMPSSGNVLETVHRSTLSSTCRPAVADSKLPRKKVWTIATGSPAVRDLLSQPSRHNRKHKELIPQSQSLRLHMTSTMIAIIGARRGPKEGTCNEGAHYQWLTCVVTSWKWSCNELQRAATGVSRDPKLG